MNTSPDATSPVYGDEFETPFTARSVLANEAVHSNLKRFSAPVCRSPRELICLFFSTSSEALQPNTIVSLTAKAN